MGCTFRGERHCLRDVARVEVADEERRRKAVTGAHRVDGLNGADALLMDGSPVRAHAPLLSPGHDDDPTAKGVGLLDQGANLGRGNLRGREERDVDVGADPLQDLVIEIDREVVGDGHCLVNASELVVDACLVGGVAHVKAREVLEVLTCDA